MPSLEPPSMSRDLVGPQKTILLSTRRTREYVRFFASVDVDVDALDLRRRGQLLDRQHLVAPSPSCCWRHSIAIVLGLGQRRNQRRSPAVGPQSARSPAAQRSARSASPALARMSATRRRFMRFMLLLTPNARAATGNKPRHRCKTQVLPTASLRRNYEYIIHSRREIALFAERTLACRCSRA